MTPAHDELKDDAAAYVLDSLEPDERAAFEAHLAGCRSAPPKCARCAASPARSLRACRSERRAGAAATVCCGSLPNPVHDKPAPRAQGRSWLRSRRGCLGSRAALATGARPRSSTRSSLQSRLSGARQSRARASLVLRPDVRARSISRASRSAPPGRARPRALEPRPRHGLLRLEPPAGAGRAGLSGVGRHGHGPVSAGLLTPDASWCRVRLLRDARPTSRRRSPSPSRSSPQAACPRRPASVSHRHARRQSLERVISIRAG